MSAYVICGKCQQPRGDTFRGCVCPAPTREEQLAAIAAWEAAEAVVVQRGDGEDGWVGCAEDLRTLYHRTNGTASFGASVGDLRVAARQLIDFGFRALAEIARLQALQKETT